MAFLSYFFPLIGAIIADSWLGKYLTITILSLVYICGIAVLTSAAIEPLNLPQKTLSMLGVILTSIGTGGIKPCVAAFGGNQFILPQQVIMTNQHTRNTLYNTKGNNILQESQLQTFFGIFYASINIGSLLSILITPILRDKVHCFGKTSCFSLAFGIPGALMTLSTVVFILGKPFYRIEQPRNNIICESFQCIYHALYRRCKKRKHLKKEHWMDYADDKFGRETIENIKEVLGILWVFIPVPIFWALFGQQSSSWLFMATHMDGNIGSVKILPDQMNLCECIFVLLLIPVFYYGLYPLLDRCRILEKPLQRMAVGGVFLALAFFISAFLQSEVEKTMENPPKKGEVHLRIFNVLPYDVNVFVGASPVVVPSMSMVPMRNLKSGDSNNVELSLKNGFQLLHKMAVKDGEAYGLVIKMDKGDVKMEQYRDFLEHERDGSCYVR